MSKTITKKPECVASAQAVVTMKPHTLRLITSGNDSYMREAFTKAQTAGIEAAKKTQESIPMCSPLPIDKLQIGLVIKDHNSIEIQTTIKTKSERTSAQMEALSAASMTAFVLKDICQSIDNDINVSDVRIVDRAS